MDWQTVLGIAMGPLLVWAAFIALLWVVKPKDVALVELLRLVPDVLRLIRDILGDLSVPIRVRIAVYGLLAWLLNPIDVIPEFILVLGPLDDVVVAVLVLRYAQRRLGAADFRRRWPGTEEGYARLVRVL